MISKTIKDQLNMLLSLKFEIDGEEITQIPNDFSEIIFYKTDNVVDTSSDKKQVIFEPYIVKPFKNFDFHDKYNNGIAPPEVIMSGTIVKETVGMYYFKLQAGGKQWEGWCPKKSCKIINGA